MAKINFTPADDMKDELWGPREAIKKARLKQNLTQEELGERIGVKRSQICKLESGKCSMTLSTMSRVFQALGVAKATLDLGIAGKVALW